MKAPDSEESIAQIILRRGRRLESGLLVWVLTMGLLLGHDRLWAGPADGLLAHYPLNGNGSDVSGNGHNGLVKDVSATANRFGQTGKALLFDGTNSFITIPDAESLRLAETDFTIAAWVFETERDAHFNDCIISKRGPAGPGRGGTGDGRGWILSIRGQMNKATTGRIFYQVSGGEDPMALSKTVLSLNQWHHVAVAYHHASASVDIFVDGAFDSTTNGVPPPNPSTIREMHIGSDSQLAYNNAYVFHGKISDVRIYNRALPLPKIEGLYGTGLFLNGTQFSGDALVRMYGGLTAGQKVVVERSPDMVHWTPMETNTVSSSSLSITNFIRHALNAEFFRISVGD